MFDNGGHKKPLSIFIGFLSLILLFSPFVSSLHIGKISSLEPMDGQTSVTWWTMFHNTPSHTGFTESSAPETSDLLWTYSTDFTTSSSVVVSHGKAYLGSQDRKIFCFDMINGDLIWDYSTNGVISSTPAVWNNRIYFGSQDYYFYCLDASTGELLWNFKTGFLIESSPNVNDGKVFFGSSDGNLYCLNAENGNLIWEFEADTIIWTSPAISENRVYFGGLNGILYCLDSYDGSLNWEYETDKGIWSSPAIYDDKVYFGSNDNFVYCLDADNGNEIWSYDTNGEVHSSPAVAYGNVYIGSSFQGLFCFDKDTGNVEWKYLFDNGIWSPPSIADGKVYFGTYHCCGDVSYVYCVDAYNKDLIWNYQTSCIMGIRSSPAIAAGKVFISLDDGQILAFGNDEELFADANGPYFGLINDQIHFKGSAYGGEPDYTWFWDFGDGNTSTQQNPSHKYTKIGLFDVVLTVTDDENSVSIDQTTVFIEEIPQNNPPTSPTINGPAQGNVNEEHDYIVRSSDIDGDDIYYIVDWGDGSPLDNFGPCQNDIDVVINHTWMEPGDFTIKCKAKDIHDLESDWNSFSVSIPRYRSKYDLLFFRFSSILQLFRLLTAINL